MRRKWVRFSVQRSTASTVCHLATAADTMSFTEMMQQVSAWME